MLLHSQVTVSPLSSRSILAEDEHEDCDGAYDDERHDECDSPGNMGAQVLMVNQGVKDGWHNEVGDSTSSVTPSTSKRIACSDHVLVEKSGRPHLARYEGTTQDTDEESNHVEARGTRYSASQGSRDSSKQQASGESHSRAETIT